MKQVIIVDDDHGPMDYYLEALRIRGFDVKQIDSTDDAYNWLKASETMKPALVVIDIMMPRGTFLKEEETDRGLLSGLFIAYDVRKRFPDVPIIILTNNPTEEVVERVPAKAHIKAKFEIAPFAFADFVKQVISQQPD